MIFRLPANPFHEILSSKFIPAYYAGRKPESFASGYCYGTTKLLGKHSTELYYARTNTLEQDLEFANQLVEEDE